METMRPSHLDSEGRARMVDVSGKPETVREAARRRLCAHVCRGFGGRCVWRKIRRATSALSRKSRACWRRKKQRSSSRFAIRCRSPKIVVEVEPAENGFTVRARVKTNSQTGVEMEALTAVSVACLTIYDMLKAVDKHMSIEAVRVIAKSGGKSGDWTAPDGCGMMTPEEARAAMLAAFTIKAKTESIALDEALGRVLAEDIIAKRDQPPFAGSAMDGYALRASETPGRLSVIGEAAAGRGLVAALKAGEAARIFTGAPMPDGADSVLIQEDALREGDVLIAPSVELAQHVRARGIDFHAGDILLRKGAPLDGVAISLAASAGLPALQVYKKPRIAILATGDEIVPPGGDPGPHQIFESGSFGIAALAKAWGAEAWRVKAQSDDVSSIAAAVEAALADADMLITIGGASVGDHDLVRPALATFDAKFAVEKIGVRPGKPTFFAQTKLGPVLGLPGNPASGLVCAHLFLKPLIEACFGRYGAPILIQALLDAPLPKNGPREHYLRSVLRFEGAQMRVRAAETQDSSLISVFQAANALIRRLPNAPAAQSGELVEIVHLGRLF